MLYCWEHFVFHFSGFCLIILWPLGEFTRCFCGNGRWPRWTIQFLRRFSIQFRSRFFTGATTVRLLVHVYFVISSHVPSNQSRQTHIFDNEKRSAMKILTENSIRKIRKAIDDSLGLNWTNWICLLTQRMTEIIVVYLRFCDMRQDHSICAACHALN